MKGFKDPLDTSFEIEGAYVYPRDTTLSHNPVDHIDRQRNAVVLHLLVIVLVTWFTVSTE